MSTHDASRKMYHFQSIVVKVGPHQSPKQLYGDEASVVFEPKAIFINKSNWCIKGKDMEKMDVQGKDKLVISTMKGKTYDFQHFLGNDASWQEFQKKLEKLYSRKTDAPKESFSNFIRGSSKLGLGSPRHQRLAPTKVVTDKKASPRRPHGVFGRARQRAIVPSLPWDIEETKSVHDMEFDDTCPDVSPPPSPVKRPVALPPKRPVDFSDDESEEEEEPVQRALTRKRRLVIDDESSEDEEEIQMDLPMTTPQVNRVVSPRLSSRSLSPQRPIDEIDKNQTTLAGFFKVAKKNVQNNHMSSAKRELDLTPRKSPVKLMSTPTRVGKSSTGSSQKRALQQKGWLSPGNNASRGRKMERFGVLSAGANEDETDFKKANDQAKFRSYSTTFGNSAATFTFHKDADREKFEKYEVGQATPKIPVAFSSPASPVHSPVRSRLSFKRVSRSPVSKHAINDLTKPQSEADLRFNQYSGLRNLGNTCYMNSCLQMMCTLPDLIKSLHNRGGELTKSLTSVADKLQENPVRAVDPHAVKEAMDAKTDKFLGYEQRDAHEFLSDLIDSIHEEVQSEKSKSFETPQLESSPMDNFLLTVRVCLTCASCGYSRSKEETYRHLSVDIISNKEGDIDTKATVEKGLEKFFEEEIREIKCEKCDEGTHATQTMQMVQRPKSLLLHLKRFIFVEVPIVTSTSNDENKSPNSPSKPVPMQYVFQKNKEQVQLSESLSLNPFFMKFPDEEATLPTESTNEYKLRSIVHHIGARASSGHYTADAIRPAKVLSDDLIELVEDSAEAAKLSSTANDDDEKQSWVTFDDTTSYITSLDKILSNQNKERTAYMLLYSLDET